MAKIIEGINDLNPNEEILKNYPEGPGALISKELMMPDDSFYQ